MSINAMKQALAALEGWANHGEWVWPESALEQAKRNTAEAITALRAAIEQAQGKHEDWCASLTQLLLSMPPKPAPCNCKPRTAPPRQWQGLTDEDMKAPIQRAMQHFGFDPTQYSLGGMATIGFYGLAKEIEAKLREKNNG